MGAPYLEHSSLGKISADGILKYCSYFSKETGFDISCELSPFETIYIKSRILVFGTKYDKYISICRLLKFIPRVLALSN